MRSDRVPRKDVAGAMQRVEVVGEHRKYAFGDRLGGPAVRRMRGADGPRLREQVDFVVAHAEYLSGDMSAGVARKRRHEGRDLLRDQVLQTFDALLLLRRVGRNRVD